MAEGMARKRPIPWSVLGRVRKRLAWLEFIQELRGRRRQVSEIR